MTLSPNTSERRQSGFRLIITRAPSIRETNLPRRAYHRSELATNCTLPLLVTVETAQSIESSIVMYTFSSVRLHVGTGSEGRGCGARCDQHLRECKPPRSAMCLCSSGCKKIARSSGGCRRCQVWEGEEKVVDKQSVVLCRNGAWHT